MGPLRPRSAAARMLRLWVPIPPDAWTFTCRVLSGRGLCDEPITHPEESYRLWCFVVCNLETLQMRRPWTAWGRSATGKENSNKLKSFRMFQFAYLTVIRPANRSTAPLITPALLLLRDAINLVSLNVPVGFMSSPVHLLYIFFHLLILPFILPPLHPCYSTNSLLLLIFCFLFCCLCVHRA
jgi:hypothetical protein